MADTLLHQFAAERCPESFALLVARHGPAAVSVAAVAAGRCRPG